MRYLIDTNILVYAIAEPDLLSDDVAAIIAEPDAVLYISAESVKEMVVAYRNKGLWSKRWKTAEDMVKSIEDEYYVKILPVKKEHMLTYSKMELNERQCHKDPSDHVIIAHAITEHLPLRSSDTPTKKPVAPLWDVCFPICHLEPETIEMKQQKG